MLANINLNAENHNRVYTVDGSIFKCKICDISLIPIFPKLIAWNLIGLTFIWLIVYDSSVEKQSSHSVNERF